MKVQNANRKVISILLVLIAAIAVISFAFFNTGNDAYVTGNIDFDNSLNITYTFTNTTNVNFTVNPIYVNDSDFVDSDSIETNVILKNDSGKDLSCSYNIYYYSTSAFSGSDGEIILMGNDANNYNEDISVDLNKEGYGSGKTPIYNGIINVKNGEEVVHNWHFNLRLYNLTTVQNSITNFNSGIRFESTGCKESILTANKTSISLSTGSDNANTEISLTSNNAGTITCTSDNDNITVAIDTDNKLTITRLADSTKSKITCSGSNGGKVVINIDTTEKIADELISKAKSSLQNGASGLLIDNSTRETGQTLNEARYIGSNPNNYVYFNCSDYSNPTSSTCELWRIMGIYNVSDGDGNYKRLVKIIRSESITNYAWDYKQNGVGGSKTNYGYNDWSTSQLMYMLNPTDYYTTTTCSYSDTTITCVKDSVKDSNNTAVVIYRPGAYYYYDSSDGSNYNYGGYPSKVAQNGINSSMRTVGPMDSNKVVTNKGIKNADTQNMIAEAKFDITGYSGVNNKASSYNTTTPSSKSYFTGKVGLLTVTDYVYATSGGTIIKRSDCLDSIIADYTTSNGYWGGFANSHYYKGICSYSNWLYDIPTSSSVSTQNSEWTMTKDIEYTDNDSVFYINANGFIASHADPSSNTNGNFTNSSKAVRPVVYLTDSIYITGGTGNIKNPYLIVAR